MAAPPKPTSVRPANLETRPTDTPQLSANIKRDPATPGRRVKAKWTVARDFAFTTDVHIYPEPNSAFDNGGAHFYIVPDNDPLYEALWYIKCVAVQETTGLNSVASDIRSFNISHLSKPINLAPTGGGYTLYGSGDIDVSWTVLNAADNDYQFAYQIVVERNSDGLVVEDTGKTLNVVANGEVDTVAVPIDAAYKDVMLRYKVRLWNGQNLPGPYSDYELFALTDGPTINITAPTGGAVATPTPTVTWTFVAAGLRDQTAFRVKILDGSDLVFDSGVQVGDDLSYIIPGGYLHTGITYTTELSVQDSGGIWVTDTQNFTTAWTPPAAPVWVLNATPYEASGYIRLTWTDAQEDAAFYAYRVYRRLDDTTEWFQLGEDILTSTPTYTYDDYLAGSNVAYNYVVVQVKTLGGDLVESNKSPQTATTSGDAYWLIDPDTEGTNFKLEHVTDEDFTHEFEEAEMNIIGRGRRVEVGTEWGYRGNITAALQDVTDMTAREQRLALEALKRKQSYLWLRNPFGDVWKISAQDITVTRVSGVGLKEHTVVEIPYAEVY